MQLKISAVLSRGRWVKETVMKYATDAMSNVNAKFCFMSDDYICDNYISITLQGDLTEQLTPHNTMTPNNIMLRATGV